ncbi:hypothetical protein LSH36_76g03048 [Paralvinella palmiformis]|uniref:Protein Wnt n=1 Tax=Paralvinella palmiformis TaxID=53620 RepID=A0AAD9NAZ7_9ANNE|nr:hypothetical protein LSH36_76g03048 [Paralvinella palmiformis]
MASFFWTKLLPFVIILVLLETPDPGRATWWYMSQLPIQALALVHNGAICGNIPGLIGRQRRLCRAHPDVMISVIDGAKLGVQECQYQFRSNRWNCSTSERDSSVFGKIMLKVIYYPFVVSNYSVNTEVGSREAAFVYGISTAGVVHAITRACSKGELLNCACDPTKVGFGKDKRGSFEWGGCSDNVMYGSRFARKFVDARETDKRDARALMNMHNNRAGRRAVRKSRKLECKCHGVSGSCALRTCWLAMHDFRQVGNMLRERYNGATQVMMDQTGTGLIVSHLNHKKPTRSDLVYFEGSPDYCVQDPVTASGHRGGLKKCLAFQDSPGSTGYAR